MSDAASSGVGFDLAGKVVLVTGAARRIGRSIALRLHREGARVLIHYSTSQAEAGRTAAECGGAPSYRANLESVDEIKAMFAQIASRVWGVDNAFMDPDRAARAGIERLEAFWSSLGLAVKLSSLGIGAERIGEMADKLSSKGTKSVGNFVKVGKAEAEAIYRLAL